MRQQTFLSAAARLWSKPRVSSRAPILHAQYPPTRIFRRQFNGVFWRGAPPKNPILTMGKAPLRGRPQHYGVMYVFFFPIPRTEILFWVKNEEEEVLLRALIFIFEAIFLGVFIYAQYVHSKSLGESHRDASNPFDPPRFTKFQIVSEEIVSLTSKILTIKPKATVKSDPYAAYWEKGLWSVEFKQPLLQIARSYTPLPPDENTAEGDLRFLIRKEPNGEMSNYLFGLQANSEVELRGPHVEFDLPKNVEEVVFLAGGTGIAPALQAVHTLLEARKSNGKRPCIRIIWANRRREDCVGGETYTSQSEVEAATAEEGIGSMVQQLLRLQQKYPENLQVYYAVDEERTFISPELISHTIQPSFEVTSETITTKSNAKLFFVSGPEGFINHFAGPKKWRNGRQEQGELGGVLGRMGLDDWKVFKL